MGLFSGDDSSAQDYLNQALQQYANVGVPSTSQLEVNNLPQETVQGSITPQEQQAVTQGDSELNGIHLDPSNYQAQQNALQGYTDIAGAGGLDANAKLGIQQAVNSANVQSQGAQGAIMKQAQAEGQGGGLNALVLRGQAAQNASNQAANTGLNEAAMAENNRQNALSQMANIGNAAESQQYGQAANTAASQNAVNANNTATRNTVNSANVDRNMAGQQANLSNAQGVNANNTAALQNQTYYNAGLPQQQFNDALAKANGMSGVYSQQAQSSQQAAQNASNAQGQLLKGGLTVAGTAMGGPLGGMAAGYLANQAVPAGTTKSSTQGGTAGVGFADGGAVKPEHDQILQDIMDKYNGVNHVQGPESGISVSQDANGHKTPSWFETAAQGMKVPGCAEVSGDSPKNDKVPAMLSPGEIVIKRSKASNPEAAAKEAKKISMEEFTNGYKKAKR